jgi:hypothetical protein
MTSQEPMWVSHEYHYHALPHSEAIEIDERESVTVLCGAQLPGGLKAEVNPSSLDFCSECLKRAAIRWTHPGGAEPHWHAFQVNPRAALCGFEIPAHGRGSRETPGGLPCLACLTNATDMLDDPGRMGTAL